MNHLELKATINQLSTGVLIDKGYHAPSVHCSYYSVLQKMKCVCVRNQNLSEEQFNNLRPEGMGVHVYILDSFKIIMKSKAYSDPDIHSFSRQVKDLKEKRVQSDYNNQPVGHSEGQEAQYKSNTILREIDQIFQ